MLRWITLDDFRSYHQLHWSPDPGVNILVGENGAGKTNLLEATAYLATLRSFRAAPDEALVADTAPAAVVRGEVDRGESSSLIEVEIPRLGRRRIRVDQKRPGRTSDLFEKVRAVTFLPQDLELIKGAPGERRDLIDGVAAQLWTAAGFDQTEYERALRQRNAFLRGGGRDSATLEVWDSRLAQAAGRVMLRRARAAQLLTEVVAVGYAQLAGREDRVTIGYQSDWGGSLDASTPPSEWSGALEESLRRRRSLDWDLGTTSVGPHRDDLIFGIGGRPARHQASQGEQRTLALALRLASHRAITDITGLTPILLLDDVFSELDPLRAGRLTASLPPAQTVITTTRPEEVPVEGKTWRIEGGLIR